MHKYRELSLNCDGKLTRQYLHFLDSCGDLSFKLRDIGGNSRNAYELIRKQLDAT